jgi:phosphoserine phosphatase
MNSRILKIIFLSTFILLTTSSFAQEGHVDSIITHILNTRQQILAKSDKGANDFIFLTFWDFDGTILNGDCSEGLQVDNKQIYKGLAQLAIENGHSNIYPVKGGFQTFWDHYKNMEHNIGRWLAYPFIPQMLSGAVLNEIDEMSRNHFETILKNYYFKSSLKILNTLEAIGIHSYIISASADVFVNAAAKTIGLDPERFHGIEVKIKNGVLTEELVYPITWADGKTKKLLSIIEKILDQNPGKKVIVLAAFGNSYSTDGPFMKYVAEQTLPAGKPLSVMINGGQTPKNYGEIFIEVEQFETSLNENDH